MVRKSLFRKIVEIGVRDEDNFYGRKPIILSNYISLILIGVNILLLVVIPGNRNLGAVAETTVTIGLFSVPFLLNHFRLPILSRLYLCWCPPLFDTWFMFSAVQEAGAASVPTLYGLRFYLLAYSCIPYLLLERKNAVLFIMGIVPSFVCLIFGGMIAELAGVNIGMSGVLLEDHGLTQIRSLVAYLIINTSCFSLKIISDKSDQVNQRLFKELADKNKLIQQQATSEVNQLNDQLRLNLQQLSEREYILNQSQRIAKVGSWEYLIDNNFLFWSDEMYNIFGIDKAFDLKLSSFSELLPHEQRKIFLDANSDLLQSGKSFDLTFQAKTPLGHRKWIRIYANPLMQENKIVGIRGIGHDITFYREAEELVRANERKYRSLFEQASDAIMITDFQGSLIEVNASLCQMFGYKKEELAQMNVSTLIEPAHLQSDPIQFETLKKGDQVINERWMVHKDGRIIIVEANVKLFSENRLMAICRDITDRKRDQEKLILSQANLNATINNTEILIWSVDRDYKLLTFNKPFYNYVKDKYARELKVGEKILGADASSEQQILTTQWDKHYLRALAGEIVTLEDNRQGRDIHYSLSPIIEGNQIIGVSVFAEDVTERKMHDRQLSEANRMLSEMKLMALRSVMSPHFIFNVLNSIQYFIAKNDRLNAINYLSTFSKLVRSVLTHSINNKIKLSEEVELLKNYVQLELTRFEQKFDFNLEVSTKLMLDEIELPSLLIQPYVENAIMHGLYNKKEKGTLWLRIDEKNNLLTFEIEDNGVGRTAAMKLKENALSSHKSMGIKLTEERLRLINQHQNTTLEIEDLVTGNSPSGTRVRISIDLDGNNVS
jgi:PAS domain S-box-containing protein